MMVMGNLTIGTLSLIQTIINKLKTLSYQKLHNI